MKRLTLKSFWRLGLFLFCGAVLLFAGCAPTLYSVNMKYVPMNVAGETAAPDRPITVTVAAFEDLRMIDNKMQIGRVVKSDGRDIPVLPKYVTPSGAVTAPFKEFLKRSGYNVSAESPAWDLKESSLDKHWGPIFMGGSIDELEVVCQDSLTLKKYNAKAKITVLFADTRTGKIFHRMTTESSSSLEHVLFSEEKLEEQINTALTGAIEKIFDNEGLASIIRKEAEKNP